MCVWLFLIQKGLRRCIFALGNDLFWEFFTLYPVTSLCFTICAVPYGIEKKNALSN